MYVNVAQLIAFGGGWFGFYEHGNAMQTAIKCINGVAADAAGNGSEKVTMVMTISLAIAAAGESC